MKKSKTGPRPNFPNTRKALRKQKRQQKKVHRQEHYLKKKYIPEQTKYTPGRFVKRPPDAPEPDTEPKKKKQKPQSTILDILNKERQKEKKEVQRLNSQMEEQRRKILVKANEDEDKVIKKLEKQLGLNKSKNKNNYFADDGLDYLLEICDRSTTEQIVAAEKHLANVDGESDFEEDLATVTGKELPKDKENSRKDRHKNKQGAESDDSDEGSDDEEISDGELSEEISDEEDGSDGFESGEDSDMSDKELEEKPTNLRNADQKRKNKQSEVAEKQKVKEKVISEEDLSKVFSDDEISHLSGDEDEEGFSGDEIDDEISEKTKEKPDVWEDIYGRKRDKEGNVIKEEKGVYIPPHLRNKDATSDKDLAQLKRQIKSVLNKLAGTNLHWASSTIESLYASNSRNSVNTVLTQLWLDACVAVAATPDRLVAEHAALVAVLHANVATEIGAHFLQELCERFDKMLQTPLPDEDKRLENIVSCLAHLYSFKIYHASLLYDVLSRLLSPVTQKRVECVVVALRCVGGVLRKEEPLALRTFIQNTQGTLAGMNESAANGSRIKFLLELLMAVKNNNLSKIPNYDPSYTEHLRKVTRGVVRKGNYVTTLNIRLEDLLKADERGKWWVVGSAWEGNRTEDRPAAKPAPAVDQKLLELARKQRMNTDVRRSIFCVIMSAEDYMDAFEKLQHLGLKGQQEREIVHVLLACCLQEKTYNPYYGVLGQKLCDYDRKYQLSIQYSVWDKIKDLDNLSKQSVANLAQFLVHLIMEKGLPLSILKIIQFSDLNKRTVKFMRQILLSIIMNEDLEASLGVFHRISKSPKLHMFKESLRLFIQHFLISMKNTNKIQIQALDAGEMTTLVERTAEVDRILTMHESKLRL